MKKKPFLIMSYDESKTDDSVVMTRMLTNDRSYIDALNGLATKYSLCKTIPTESSIDVAKLFDSSRHQKTTKKG